MITPWGTDYYNGGLLVLTVTQERTAAGSIIDKASFMTLRQQRFTQRAHGRSAGHHRTSVPAATGCAPMPIVET